MLFNIILKQIDNFFQQLLQHIYKIQKTFFHEIKKNCIIII